MEDKKCYICKYDKPLSEFYIHHKHGHQHYCKDCTKEKVRLKGQTLNGLIYRIYKNQKHNAIRRGMLPPTYPFEWLDKFAKDSEEFIILYIDWHNAGYPRHLTPSIDRINNNISYIESNIQVMTWGDNKNKEHLAVITGGNTKNCKAIIGIEESTGIVHHFHSIHNAGIETGVDYKNVSACCRGLRKRGNGFIFMYEGDYNE